MSTNEIEHHEGSLNLSGEGNPAPEEEEEESE